MSYALAVALLILAAWGYRSGRNNLVAAVAGGAGRPLSQPSYHGYYVALWAALPGLFILAAWLAFEPILLRAMVIHSLPDRLAALPPEQIERLVIEVRGAAIGDGGAVFHDEAAGLAAEYARWRNTAGAAVAAVIAAMGAGGLALAGRRVAVRFRARERVERAVLIALMACSLIAILTTLGIFVSLLVEASRFFAIVPPADFLFGLTWSPQIAMRADQVGASGSFGAVPLLAGTLLISAIALAVAVPIGLMSAIYLADYAAPNARAVFKPLLEVLAGIPTVVYGYFAALNVAPLVRQYGGAAGFDVASESALAAGLVMGIMIIPYVSSLSDDVITAVPQAMRDGSLAMGATKSETVKRVVLPAALPGIIGAILLAFSRAIGETMIVVMAAGLTANLTANPFAAVTTITVQVATLLVGDQEFDNPKTLAAFALGLTLFLATLVLNVMALVFVRRYREQYD
jgi:phosphate transport system permease protein